MSKLTTPKEFIEKWDSTGIEYKLEDAFREYGSETIEACAVECSKRTSLLISMVEETQSMDMSDASPNAKRIVELLEYMPAGIRKLKEE